MCPAPVVCMLARVPHVLQGHAHRSTSADDRPSHLTSAPPAQSTTNKVSHNTAWYVQVLAAAWLTSRQILDSHSQRLLQCMSSPAGGQHAWRGNSVNWKPLEVVLSSLAKEWGNWALQQQQLDRAGCRAILHWQSMNAWQHLNTDAACQHGCAGQPACTLPGTAAVQTHRSLGRQQLLPRKSCASSI